MVKLDTSRDYYGDLGLPPTCSAEDVKKQFRKLALQYHPDRNPGRELEVQPRFQAIQAAHEVLTDPEQRNKYDAVRVRNYTTGTSQRPAPPSRAGNTGNTANPYTAHSDYPPPPRRTGPTAGAERYSNFVPPPTRKEPTSSTQDANTRYNAWQSMHSRENPPPSGWGRGRSQNYDHPAFHNAPPYSGRNSSSSEARYEPSPPKPSAWEYAQRKAPGTGRPQPPRPPPRKGGFDPSSHMGDEAPAPSSYGRAQHPRMPEPFPPPPTTPRAQAPTARRPDLNGPAAMDPPFVERTRTPYATNVTEEKTYFSTDDLRRSASTRDTTKLHNPEYGNGQPSHLDPNRPRSASPPRKTNRTDETGQKHDTGTASRPFVAYSSAESSSDIPTDESVAGGSKEMPPRPKVEPSAAWKNRNKGPGLGKARSFENSRASTPGQEGVDGARDFPRPTIFTFPVESDTFTPTSEPLRAQSSGHIDTNFSSGSGPIPFFSTPGAPVGGQRRESHPTDGPPRGRYPERSNQGTPASDFQPTGTAPPSHFASQAPSPSPSGATFSADRWSTENWTTPWATPLAVPPLGVSPTRQSARRARGGDLRANTSATTKQTGTPKPSSVEEEETGDPSNFTGSNVDSGTGDTNSDAMEIDPTPSQSHGPSALQSHGPPPLQSHGPPPSQSHGPPPSQSHGTPPQGLNGDRRTSVAGNMPPPPPGPPPGSSSRSGNLNMDDFRHVPPFQTMPAGNGLEDLSDMTANLPFPSQASSAHPDRHAKVANNLPLPPKVPVPPTKLTPTNWKDHLRSMTHYITLWNLFNMVMTDLQSDRARKQTKMDEGYAGGLLDGWLGALGEPGQLVGWNTYVQYTKEDQRIRTHWQVACEKHVIAVENHEKLRNQILRNGGLQ